MRLTEEGMLLRRRAQEMADLAQKTERELKHGKEAVLGEISIGCGETQNMKPLCDRIALFRQIYPDVTFDICTAIADDVKERLENGSLDLGLLLEPVEISRYHFIRMPLKESFMALMRRDDPLAEKKKITPKDLAGIPLIVAKRRAVRNELEHWFGDDRDKMEIASMCNLSHYNQQVMVESGIGIAMGMGFSVSNEMLCMRPLEPELVSGCVLAWKKNQVLSQAMSRFLALVRTHFSDTL